MIRRFLILTAVLIVFYVGFIQIQIFQTEKRESRSATQPLVPKGPEDPFHRVYSFTFSKYTTEGDKEIEIEGDSADVFTRNVILKNVIAKAYAEESPVTITADGGEIDKTTSRVRLKENVVATTEDGTRLLTEALDIFPARKMVDTELDAEVKRDNINIEGVGARGDSRLKKVKFKKNVTVIVRDPDSETKTSTIITCDGPLVVNYEEDVARFQKNVVAEDERGKIYADTMDVYYNKDTRRVSKIVAVGNVVIENPDGNQTFSDNVIYLAEEGRIILGGDAEALYREGTNSVATELL